jgi:hypothetical protein
MAAAFATVTELFEPLQPRVLLVCEPTEPYGAPSPEPVRLDPLTSDELARIRGGECEADLYERGLAWAARVRSAIDVKLAEGLHLLRKGDRLAELGFRLDDHVREVLDLGEHAGVNLAKLGGELRERPLLKAAMEAGRVRLRAAQTVTRVAVGDAEAFWVERAAREPVRELEELVRRAGAEPPEPEEDWFRLRTHLPPDERLVVEAALECARRILPGSSRAEQWEAIAQEFRGEFGADDGGGHERHLRSCFRRLRVHEPSVAPLTADDREGLLAPMDGCPAPEVQFDDADPADEVDRKLRGLARLRRETEDLLGHCAHAIRRTGLHLRLGFESFRHYVEERLQLPPRAVEQRERLEKRLWESPALREAKRQGVSREKLRLLAALPEKEIGTFTAVARAVTCVELRRRVEGQRERQMRAARTIEISLPRRLAVLLATVVAVVRERFGRLLPTGRCLAIASAHFFRVWSHMRKRAKTVSQKVRERDEGWCMVPGCSHVATDSHHVLFRSRGGGDEEENLVALCEFHHLRCIHGGWLTVTGRAPDGLTWRRKGVLFTGMA